jgi:hypothetical protein
VATATANHNRAARWGLLMRVRCHWRSLKKSD